MALEGTETVSNTERSLPGAAAYSSASPQTTTGTYQVFIDASAMVLGDEFRLRVYEKVKSGGTQRVIYERTLKDVYSELIALPALKLKNGWDVTMLRVSATDRAFDFSIR